MVTIHPMATKPAARRVDRERRRINEECRARILAVVDETAQLNLNAAVGAGALNAAQMDVYRAGVAWIHGMRAAQADGNWPDVPVGVAELAAEF